MTLLDDARRLLEIGVQCDHCTGSPTSGHLGGCPLPRIVSALEAAKAVVDDYKPSGNWARVMIRLEDALEG